MRFSLRAWYGGKVYAKVGGELAWASYYFNEKVWLTVQKVSEESGVSIFQFLQRSDWLTLKSVGVPQCESLKIQSESESGEVKGDVGLLRTQVKGIGDVYVRFRAAFILHDMSLDFGVHQVPFRVSLVRTGVHITHYVGQVQL